MQHTKKQNNRGLAASLVAKLNQQYKAIERNLKDVKTAADSDVESEFASLSQRGRILNDAFDKTLAQLLEMGETVKFDNANGEYFLGERKFRIEFRMVSVGTVEIEAPTEQIAMLMARKMADYDQIEMSVVSGTLTNRTEAV